MTAIKLGPYTLPLDGDWGYEVDDFGDIHYGPGWFPFRFEGQVCSIRVAPDVAYYSWGSQYVTLSPGRGSTVLADVHLGGPRHGTSAIIRLDVRARTFTLPDDLPPDQAAEGAAKARRLLDLLHCSRAERNRGQARPVTAYDRWMAAKETAAQEAHP